MSLILEALRKSEAERRRGQAPGLFVEQMPTATRQTAKTPGWAWALVGLLALVLAAWGWREFGADRADATTTVDAAADALPTATTLWRTDDEVLSPDNPVTLSWDNGQGLRFTVTFEVISKETDRKSRRSNFDSR